MSNSKEYLTTVLIARLRNNPNLKYKWLPNGSLRIQEPAGQKLSSAQRQAQQRMTNCQRYEQSARFGHVCHSYKGEGLRHVN